MTAFQRMRVGAAVLADAIGLIFVGFAAYYTVMLLVDPRNPLRYEYRIGIWGGLLYGFVGLLIATFLAISVKKAIPKRLFKVLTVPALLVGIVLLAMNFYAAATYLVGRAT